MVGLHIDTMDTDHKGSLVSPSDVPFFPAVRRPRSDTFHALSIPSSAVVSQSENGTPSATPPPGPSSPPTIATTPPSVTSHPVPVRGSPSRARAISLSVSTARSSAPSGNPRNPFGGNGLFSPTWQIDFGNVLSSSAPQTSVLDNLGPNGSVVPRDRVNDKEEHDAVSSVVRTFNYLGLDDSDGKLSRQRQQSLSKTPPPSMSGQFASAIPISRPLSASSSRTPPPLANRISSSSIDSPLTPNGGRPALELPATARIKSYELDSAISAAFSSNGARETRVRSLSMSSANAYPYGVRADSAASSPGYFPPITETHQSSLSSHGLDNEMNYLSALNGPGFLKSRLEKDRDRLLRPRSSSFHHTSNPESNLGININLANGYDKSLGDFENPLPPTPIPLQESHPPTRSLWIGNLPPSFSTNELLSLFSPFGPIESLRLLPDRECAFVNYFKVEDAVKAREFMSGKKIGSIGGSGLKIGFGKVNKAEGFGLDRMPNGLNKEKDGPNTFEAIGPTRALWVGNLPPNTTVQQLSVIFSPFGHIDSCRILTHKNCGFVNFRNEQDAIAAKKTLNGREINSNTGDVLVLRIGFAKVPTSPPKQPTGVDATKTIMTNIPSSSPSSPSPALNADASFGAFHHASSSPANTPSSPMHDSMPEDRDYDYAPGVPVLTLEDLRSPVSYADIIPAVPEPSGHRRIDQARLRDMRRKLDAVISNSEYGAEGQLIVNHGNVLKEVEMIFDECLEDAVELSIDYIGNTVLQKLIVLTTNSHRLRLIYKIAPHFAAIGVHKHGTWVIQKIIDTASTPQQIFHIANAVRSYTPPLLLDQFGNYVVQCCLRFGTEVNDFIFEAMKEKCVDIAQGRFGARAMRACLESQYASMKERKQVAIAIVQNALALCTNPNGSLLLTWLLDSSSLPGRYKVLAPKIVSHLSSLCTHKLASTTVFKIINQTHELDARELILKEIFYGTMGSPQSFNGAPNFSNPMSGNQIPVLDEILSDQIYGVPFIQKVVGSISDADEKATLMERVKSSLGKFSREGNMYFNQPVNPMGYPYGYMYPTPHGASGFPPQFVPPYGNGAAPPMGMNMGYMMGYQPGMGMGNTVSGTNKLKDGSSKSEDGVNENGVNGQSNDQNPSAASDKDSNAEPKRNIQDDLRLDTEPSLAGLSDVYEEKKGKEEQTSSTSAPDATKDTSASPKQSPKTPAASPPSKPQEAPSPQTAPQAHGFPNPGMGPSHMPPHPYAYNPMQPMNMPMNMNPGYVPMNMGGYMPYHPMMNGYMMPGMIPMNMGMGMNMPMMPGPGSPGGPQNNVGKSNGAGRRTSGSDAENENDGHQE